MKTLISAILLLFLSTSLFSADNYKFDIYNVDAYNRSIPAISLAITPKNSSGFQFILSYVSTLFSFEKPVQEYTLNDKYTNVQMSLNFRF
ncbi:MULTISPECIES: hypothetical protein [Sulfurimonas]|uniref:hypothetical protein n=1 Tax=Sulfurimonas TaxID=202746 RepID=UPI0012641C86|nr:hypothetical protein [Sulfurimonas indica]